MAVRALLAGTAQVDPARFPTPPTTVEDQAMNAPLHALLHVAAACWLAVAWCGEADRRSEAGPRDEAVRRGETHQPSVAIVWDDAALAAIRAVKPGPPICARELAIVSTCMYDAWAAYDHVARGTRYGGALRRPLRERFSLARKRAAVSFAAYRALVDLFPTQRAQLDAVMAGLGYDPADTSTDPRSPAGIGNLAAAAVLAVRHHDGANQLGDLAAGGVPYADYSGYVAVNPPIPVQAPSPLSAFPVPGRWQPLSFPNDLGAIVTPGFITPFWGRVQPFALASGEQLRPVPPPAWDSPEMLAEADELIAISAALIDRQKCIAEYWADGPHSELPPGHWNLFAQVVSARDHHALGEDIKLLFALNNAQLDAGIATWEAKRSYDFWRPVSAIRYLRHGQAIVAWGGPGLGARTIPGESWRPFQKETFPTPPFPEYTSGHSAFSTASAEVLRRFTGSDRLDASAVIAAHSLLAEPAAPAVAITLRWTTFSAAADEAGLSRRYGGIHFASGDLAGRALGRCAGALAFERARRYWSGFPVDDEDCDRHPTPRADD
jgi:hypothetical protein